MSPRPAKSPLSAPSQPRLQVTGCCGRAKAGADVVLSYNSSSDKAVQIGQEITEMGRRAVAFQCDVGDSAQCDDLARKAEKAFGQIDVLISNAGMGQGNGIAKTPDEEWERTMNVNARASFCLARALLPGMVERKFGRVRRHDIAAIWVAFFSRSQRYRC